MSILDDEFKVEGVYGGVQSYTEDNATSTATTNSTSASENNLPVTRSFWSNMKAFWLQEIDLKQKIDWKKEIKVELTPYQQKLEDQINEFLHQDITWDKFRSFLTQPVTFGKN